MEENNEMKVEKKVYKGNVIPGHEFDGIKELDNPPPPWLMWLFYISIFFSIVYWLHFHVLDQGALQEEEYQIEMAKAQERIDAYKSTQEQVTIELLTAAEDLEEGKKMYNEKACFACHGMNLEGNAVGPNLVDNYWINGGKLEDIVNIIKVGAPAKGMTAFQDQFNDKQLLQLASYIISLQGSNPPNAKDPQGVKYER